MPIRSSQKLQRLSGYFWPEENFREKYDLDFVDTFEQVTISHPKYTRQGSGDGGGAWWMEKTEHFLHPAQVWRYPIGGPMVGYYPVDSVVPSDAAPSSYSDMRGMGTKAISLCLPTNPTFNLAQFLGELREGAPKAIGSGLLKEKTRLLKGSGSEYLNVEFGWKPLVNDVQNFAHAVKHADKIIDQYRKDSGRKIRRRYVYPPTTETSSHHGSGVLRPTAVGMWADFTVTRHVKRASWFSGAFKYFVPIGDSSLDKLKQHVSYADKLLGLRITPELMWNLSPWTWAADWFANTGDILHNISALGDDGLVMQYGYMMDSLITEEVFAYKFDYFEGTFGGLLKNSAGSHERVHSIKRRVPASPYGFDLTFDGFSNRQKAITAAIGVTRKR